VSPLGGVGFRPVEVANPFAKRLRRRREVPSVESPAVGDADSHASAVMGRGKNLGVAELGYDKFIVRSPQNNSSKNAELMQCPECQSTHVNKNGQKKVKRIIFVSVVADNL